MARTTTPILAVVLALGWAVACADEGRDGESAGEACVEPATCYEAAARDDIVGEIVCLDRVPGGYCTHLCESDADCCAAAGECGGRLQVCAPFESTGMMMCFLSCEAEDVEDDPDAYCHDFAHNEFTCRSTGGGSANRKVCA